MKKHLAVAVLAACLAVLLAPPAHAKPSREAVEITPADIGETDAVGDLDGTHPLPAKAAGDTVWIADWTFDAPDGSCDDTGWTKYDNRIRNDGSNYWHIDSTFDGVNGIVGQAAVLSNHDLFWASPTGYGNQWDYSIICKYRGSNATLSFNFVSDSEPGYDFFTVEADSAGASESQVNYSVDPSLVSTAPFRDELLSYTGLVATASVTGLLLPAYGQPLVTHEVYLRFSSDAAWSDEDGRYPSHWGAGCVVDNIQITGTLAYTEDFENALNPSITLVNSAIATPFGLWVRLYRHVTDNDRCNENTTCAWLWSDPLRPAEFPDMAFGPGGAVLRGWLDNSIVSPWVSLGSSPPSACTVVQWRRNASQRTQGEIGQNWSVRSRVRVENTNTPGPEDSIDCVTPWLHASSWSTFNSFTWRTNTWDLTPYVPTKTSQVQLRIRTADIRLPYLFNDVGPHWVNPGPGPFIDRIRIGRYALPGPVLDAGSDARSQAQDCFPTRISPVVPQHGRHVEPETDTSAPLYKYIFGTCDFSAGADLGINVTSPNVVTGDSISIAVTDVRGAGGIASVKWFGAVVAGPHTGKAPAPYTVGPNGFFEVQPDSCRTSTGDWVANTWFVNLDDTYFRGGDQLDYFWYATDGAGGGASSPAGITAGSFPPASTSRAEILLDGLYEVSYLPTIRWDPGYLARIAADPHGDLDPTAAEVAGSSQQNCILYYQHSNSARRSGPTQRTSFMYALDRLGYAGCYDIYDVQGYGNTNNQLGGRATVAQASGYALVIEDDGRSTLTVNVPDGSNSAQKVNQAQWYRDYLAQGLTGRAGTATLWLLGESTAYEKATNALFTTDFGLTGIANDQGVAVNPELAGLGTFTAWNGCPTSFTGDSFTLNGGCPSVRNYDNASAAGTAVVTHRLKAGSTLGPGAVVMNSNAALHWNTVWMGFGWFDLLEMAGTPPGPNPAIGLMQKILACVLPEDCLRSPGTTGPGPDPTEPLPRVTALFQNTPNPFNPTTTIHFDLAREGRVTLRIYDVAGRMVKTLIDGKQAPGRNRTATWSGNIDSGERAPSGVYFYRLVTDDYTATKKMVLMK